MCATSFLAVSYKLCCYVINENIKSLLSENYHMIYLFRDCGEMSSNKKQESLESASVCGSGSQVGIYLMNNFFISYYFWKYQLKQRMRQLTYHEQSTLSYTGISPSKRHFIQFFISLWSVEIRIT